MGETANHTLVGLSYSICSQGDRLTGAFNYYYPLPEGPILKKISNTNRWERKCQTVRNSSRENPVTDFEGGAP